MSAIPIVLVDANNVRRSLWPNLSKEDVRGRSRAWAEARGAEAEVVFDGRESADDRIVRRADELAAEGRPLWLVTSDRELRERAGGQAERVIGGGAFARELAALGASGVVAPKRGQGEGGDGDARDAEDAPRDDRDA